MKNKHPHPSKWTAAEEQLIKQSRQHPELLERFQSIVAITSHTDGPVKQADEIEALLIEELRRLGNASMESWARGAEQALGEQLKQKDSTAVVRKKKR